MYNSPNFFPYQSMYYSSMPTPSPKVSLFSKLKGANWSNFLNNTSRTLNVINQAIPLYYQVRPLIRNASTLFRIADIIRSDEKEVTPQAKTSSQPKKEETSVSSDQPTFFL